MITLSSGFFVLMRMQTTLDHRSKFKKALKYLNFRAFLNLLFVFSVRTEDEPKFYSLHN